MFLSAVVMDRTVSQSVISVVESRTPPCRQNARRAHREPITSRRTFTPSSAHTKTAAAVTGIADSGSAKDVSDDWRRQLVILESRFAIAGKERPAGPASPRCQKDRSVRQGPAIESVKHPMRPAPEALQTSCSGLSVSELRRRNVRAGCRLSTSVPTQKLTLEHDSVATS